jgi:hypothetical protein
MLENQFRGRNDHDNIRQQFLNQWRVGLDGIKQAFGSRDRGFDHGFVGFGETIEPECYFDAEVYQTAFAVATIVSFTAAGIGVFGSATAALTAAAWFAVFALLLDHFASATANIGPKITTPICQMEVKP